MLSFWQNALCVISSNLSGSKPYFDSLAYIKLFAFPHGTSGGHKYSRSVSHFLCSVVYRFTTPVQTFHIIDVNIMICRLEHQACLSWSNLYIWQLCMACPTCPTWHEIWWIIPPAMLSNRSTCWQSSWCMWVHSYNHKLNRSRGWQWSSTCICQQVSQCFHSYATVVCLRMCYTQAFDAPGHHARHTVSHQSVLCLQVLIVQMLTIQHMCADADWFLCSSTGRSCSYILINTWSAMKSMMLSVLYSIPYMVGMLNDDTHNEALMQMRMSQAASSWGMKQTSLKCC